MLNKIQEKQVVYDVATNKDTVVIVKDTVTGRLKLVPADSAPDMDTTGEIQPAPRENPGLFGQPTNQEKLKEILPDFRDSGFDEDFYQ